MLTDDRRAEIAQLADERGHLHGSHDRECLAIRDLLAAVDRLREALDAAEATLGDEEAAHQETVQLWQTAKSEAERLAAENARLTRQLKECWALLRLATIPMGIGPGAERLLRSHGQPT